MSTQALPAKNHNNPPSDLEFLGENLILRHVHIIRAAEGHVDIATKMPDHFSDASEAAWTTDFIALMQNCVKELERRRKEEKEPFLRQGQYIDSFFDDHKNKVGDSITKANRVLGDWLRRVAEAEKAAREADAKLLREQEQAALRAAAEFDRASVTQAQAASIIEHAVTTANTAKVAEAIAAQPITSMARTTGKSATAGLATKWVGTIKDIDQLDLHKLRPYIARAELEKALERYVRQGGRICDGAEIKEVINVKVK